MLLNGQRVQALVGGGDDAEEEARVRGSHPLGARKRAKGAIWDELVRVTGYHHKAAVRLPAATCGAGRKLLRR